MKTQIIQFLLFVTAHAEIIFGIFLVILLPIVIILIFKAHQEDERKAEHLSEEEKFKRWSDNWAP